MIEIIYNSAVPYTAFVGSGAVNMLGETARRSASGSAAVITDDGVPAEHVFAVCERLLSAGFSTECFALPAGEANKNLSGIERLYAFFYELGLTRKSAVVAVGGGVVGDMAGFAAATFLRGLAFINVPTTLVAQTDSAYGGKTGVDFMRGKNYVGSFYDPAAVICDTDFLRTLPEEQRLCGMGEIIKYGAIADESLLVELERTGADIPNDSVIARCVELKRSFVEGDEHDNGRRRMLNFGHTIGHAIEADSGYSIPHGQAVAYGMLAAARIGERLGVTAPGVYNSLLAAAAACGLDTDWHSRAASALPLTALDKKSDGASIDMILLKKTGEPMVIKLAPEEVAKLICA